MTDTTTRTRADRLRARARAWGRAYRRLAHLHPDEFERLLADEMHAEGLPR